MNTPITPNNENQPRLPEASHAAIFYISLIFVLILGVNYLGLQLIEAGISEDSQLFMAIGATAQSLLIIASVIVIIRINRLDLRATLRLRPCPIRFYLWGALGIIPLGVIVSQMAQVLVQLVPEMQSQNLVNLVETSSYSGDALVFAFFAIAVSLGAGISEELAFRGFILRGLESSGPAIAVVVSGLVFALFHFDPLHVLVVFPAGVFLGYLTLQSGSIFPAILAHVINNLWSLFEVNLWQAIKPGISFEEIAFSESYSNEILILAAAILILALYYLQKQSANKTL